ncbi:expressed unknown protein [Seminavis robusta]|uniref:Uncharacterized protein n=1 Tax=Seminavis robusta TaxID=568900 RepID=A0A9N8HZZ1_9STRA|nr:expressed unknown protein [Seminavis robusta]|eukprot:Sro3267_g346020.1 n/a (299) ;mRNA; f:304-1200
MSASSTPAGSSSAATASLPSSIAQAISEMQMPLSTESYAPMYYKSLPEMVQIRRDVPNMPDFVRDVVGTIALIVAGSKTNNDEKEYLARCAAALILLGHGGTDEAHDLVSPLSWPNELPFAYGPPVVVPEQVLTLASYVHALVHRREGPFESEFGMTGFNNADYWAGSALRSPEGAEALPLEEIRTSILNLAQTMSSNPQQQSAASSQAQAQAQASSPPALQQWMQTHFAEQELAFPAWDPRALNELCSNLQQQQQQQQQPAAQTTNDDTLQQFAEQAVLLEMKILLKHTLKAIGYDV